MSHSDVTIDGDHFLITLDAVYRLTLDEVNALVEELTR